VLNCTGGLVPVNGACGCPAGTTLGAGGQRCLTQCPAGQAHRRRCKWKPDYGHPQGRRDAGEQHLHMSGRYAFRAEW
jgi:hypothetical protein